MITNPPQPPFKTPASLHFLEGQYLLTYQDGEARKSKFVTAADVAAAFTGAEVDTGWLPTGIVRTGSNACGSWYVYSTPPQKALLTLEGEEPIEVPLPRLVLLGAGSRYYLWASKGRAFDPDAPACHAPFPNVHDGGQICWGASTPPAVSVETADKAWALFFQAPFNGHLADGKSKRESKDVRRTLRRLAGRGARVYPTRDLIAHPQPVGWFIARILGER